MEAIFSPIDVNTWPRAQTFHYYTKMAPTSYTVNVTMDATILKKTLNEKGYKFFPAYLYLVSRGIEKQKELRTAVKDDEVGTWDYLTPVYPQFHEDDTTTTLLWTEYDSSFETFYAHYIDDTAKHSCDHGILSAKGVPPPNAYMVSCIPWLAFNSFCLHNHGNENYFFPVFESGRMTEKDGRIQMPLSVTVHHATTDGYHLHVFFEELQRMMDHPQDWLE